MDFRCRRHGFMDFMNLGESVFYAFAQGRIKVDFLQEINVLPSLFLQV